MGGFGASHPSGPLRRVATNLTPHPKQHYFWCSATHFATRAFVAATGKWVSPLALAPRTWLFLVLSGLATGASWTCYFRALKLGDASKVAPVDKLSLLLVVLMAVVIVSINLLVDIGYAVLDPRLRQA